MKKALAFLFIVIVVFLIWYFYPDQEPFNPIIEHSQIKP